MNPMREPREEVLERVIEILRGAYEDARAIQDGVHDASASTRVREDVRSAILILRSLLPEPAPGLAAQRIRRAFRVTRLATGTDASVGRLLGVTRHRVGRLKRGIATLQERELLERLAAVVEQRRLYLQRRHAEAWLTTGLAELGGRSPLDVLRERGVDEVLRLPPTDTDD